MQAKLSHPGRGKDDLGNLAVPTAAHRLISRSLTKVQTCLQRAAKSAHKDTEHVHRLRVATRQANAALEVFRELLPRNQRQPVVRNLKKIRTVAAKARDLDVFIELHKRSDSKSKKLLKSLTRKRRKAQKPISAIYEKTKGKSSFRKRCKKLLVSLEAEQQIRSETFSQWARLKTQTYCQDFIDHCNFDIGDLKQLHKFRIAVKKFRYQLNVVAPAFPDGTFDPVQQRLKTSQDLLGEINDRAVAIGRLEKLCGDESIPSEVMDRELAALQTAKDQFGKFWQPEMGSEIQAAVFK